jgi:hypothetical protein
MREDYGIVTDEQVVEKTGKPLAHWTQLLQSFGAEDRKSNESVDRLQSEHSVPRYGARALTARYLKGLR